MADTLRSLAGATFRTADVISNFHAAVTTAEAVLDRYVFLPHARTGIAAALTTPFAWTLPTRATVMMRVPVIDDRGGVDAEMTVHVYGPADVTEIDPRQAIRAFPKIDAANAEVDDLAHVEFDRPDLPWLFTPAGPDAQGRLVPWVTLVVAERRHLDWGERRGTVRRARIRRDQLQPLGDAWAWAHAQVMGAKAAARETEPTLERRLSANNAPYNLSRLVCPRRLDDHTSYVACVVPTFLAGVQAGLGLTPTATLAPAWGTADNFSAGGPLDVVELPVYYAWAFGTGEEGNFESLARKLRPVPAPAGVGRRRVDATQPWKGAPLEVDSAGAEIVVKGPVVSLTPPDSEATEAWPSEERQQWPPEVASVLIDRLNHPDRQAHAADPGPPVVGPPLYGGLHARQPRVEEDAAPAAAQPQWFRELNLDPRNRIVAGLGTRVVQAEQEDLMLAAWNQVIGVEAANRALRLAQLAKHVGASLHRRHLTRLTDTAVVSMTERVHAKVLDAPQRSVWASIDTSSLPHTVTAGAFRRLVRVRGPVARVALKSRNERVRMVEALTVRNDRLTASWVVRYASPDGMRGLSEAAAARLTPEIAARVAPGADRDALLAQWRAALAKPAPPDRLAAASLSRPPDTGRLDLGAALVTSLAQRLVATAPTERQMEADPESAITGASHATLLRTMIELASGSHVDDIAIPLGDAKRLRLDVTGRDRDPRRVTVNLASLRDFSARALALARQHDVPVPFEDFTRSGERLRQLVAANGRVEGRSILAGLSEIGARAIGVDPFVEPVRARIDAPGLGLVAKLNPATTVPARIAGRFTSGSGRLPSWLPPGWFDNQRVEPVMAHPRFKYPMYEPLHRYDREWMVPGLGLITRPDMTTLLETNNRFIEGYLVGLNHEMARELLWREFPTDQRGTYFSSFWTGAPELTADLHEAPWRTGALRSHVDPRLDGQLVFLVRGDLVRRYPGVVAHAAIADGEDANGIPVFNAASPVETLFHVFLPPNVLLVGFALTRARIEARGEKWWFTLSENPTEPRFGLDPSRPDPQPSRDNLIWADFGLAEAGGFLDATQHTNIRFDDARWGASSATVAYLLFQLPARAAFSAKKMIAKAAPNG